ncbi:hypothetical protein FRC01_012397 [Tulasnella sp. 417]|nr:hypothetical protein FRC01_012397 [Tulasnella sp. 417]
MPDIPKEFGDDEGNFFMYYDKLADEIDEDVVKSLQTQLDGMLIFAGLFASVITAFLALTLPQMSADPAEDTNALLLQIALGGNGNITSVGDLPSASFTPPPHIYPINVLFSVSLTLTLLSSILAVLGLQWIVYYRKRGGGGPESERWDQLRRYLGAKRWGLELVLNNLVPSLLLLGLVIFCIAFALYLKTLNGSLNRIIARLLWIAVAAILGLSACVAFDEWCPFKLPWSRIVRPGVCAIVAAVAWVGQSSLAISRLIGTSIITAPQFFHHSSDLENGSQSDWRGIKSDEAKELMTLLTAGPEPAYKKFLPVGTRTSEEPDVLKAKALKRVICTSEDRNALVYSAINLQALQNQPALSSLAKDRVFCERMFQLCRAGFNDPKRRQSGGRSTSIESRVFSTTFFHFLITTGSIQKFSWREQNKGIMIALADLRIRISVDDIRDLSHRGRGMTSGGCDQCSHCKTLQFSMRVVNLVAEGLNATQPTDFKDAFQGVARALTQTKDLRLGCVVASVIICSKKWYDVEPQSLGTWERSKLLEGLFSAYRLKSEADMFKTISTALDTVPTAPDTGVTHWEDWAGKPSDEIYVRLFELCLLFERDGITVDRDAVLKRFGDHLLSIEKRIRDKNGPGTDRQHGRDHQNRYVQSAAASFKAHKDKWSVIGASMARYLDYVRKQMETDPRHSANPGTAVLLRHIKSSFPRPAPSELDSSKAYSKFGELLSYVESIWSREASEGLGLRYQRLSCIQKRGEMWYSQPEPAIQMLAL